MADSNLPAEPSRTAAASEQHAGPHFPGLSRVERLSSGGMGTVFRAWQEDLARPVAVKTLRDDLRGDATLHERFGREAQILARLDHPGIVPVYDSGRTANGPYYVMRLVEGRFISEALKDRPATEIATAFRDVALALSTAHAAGVLHCDLKPDNVLVEGSGRAVLVDFGLATRRGAPSSDRGVAGSIDYLAPELLQGAVATESSDVYALGATLYATLTGTVPFPHASLDAKLRAIREDEPRLPREIRPDVSKALQAICLKAMERAPADRYGSARDLASDLDRFVRGDVVQALPVRSRSLLRRKIELHLAEVSSWAEQGLLDEQQLSALQGAYEKVETRERGLLRGTLGSLENVLLFVGILICVFGPVLLLTITWDEQAAALRLLLPALPLALLAGAGLWRWRAQDHHRAVVCWFGATLLVPAFAFALSDFVPALHSIRDAAGVAHAVRPGDLWDPAADAPDWMRTGARLLEWKLLLCAAVTLAAALVLYKRTRAAAFLWVALLAGGGALVCGARVFGWSLLPVGWRWAFALGGSLGTIGIGVGFDRRFRRDRALPFYGLGFVASVVAVLTYLDSGVPVIWLGVANKVTATNVSTVLHGLLFTALGLAVHTRGAPLLRQGAGFPLVAGFALAMIGMTSRATTGGVSAEIAVVGVCLAYLLLGLYVNRNSLVLISAIILPLAVGAMSQRHVHALWAWSASIVLGGATLVVLGLRRTVPGSTTTPSGLRRERSRAP
jgi:hypothetical protein